MRMDGSSRCAGGVDSDDEVDDSGAGAAAPAPKKPRLKGDAWFGSTKTAYFAKKKFGVDSTCVVKTAHSCPPKKQLEPLPRAGPRGPHRTYEAEIDGVKLIAVGYKYNTSSVCSFISTCGVATAGQPHTASYAAGGGKVQKAPVYRPKVIEQYYEHCTMIDDHNKYRQSHLAVELSWPTSDCWFRLLCTTAGVCVTDMYLVVRQQQRLPGVCSTEAHTVADTIRRFVQVLTARTLGVKRPPQSNPRGDVVGAGGGLHYSVPATRRAPPRKPASKLCAVNKKPPGKGARVKTEQPRCKVCHKATSRLCGLCEGACCPRTSTRPCWQTHIDTKVTGLKHSGARVPRSGTANG